MSDLISMDKQYRTRNGDAVEVLKIGINHDSYPVAVVITMDDGSQIIRSRTGTGRIVRVQRVEPTSLRSNLGLSGMLG